MNGPSEPLVGPAGAASAAESLERRLRDGPGDWVALEDFAPLPDCLEWRLSRAYWDQRGSSAFFGGDVPYVAINDGRLSCDTARFLVELCAGDAARAPRVLEVGGGSGLFARLFLDELRSLSPELYDTTTYVWTDASPAMVEQAVRHGTFAAHADRVQLRRLELPAMADLDDAADGGFDLVIANYAVDNLPATMLRLAPGRIDELQVRATLPRGLAPARLHGQSADEWAARLRDGRAGEHELVELYPWFSLECRYMPIGREALPLGAAVPDPPAGQVWHWLHHESALRWLGHAVPLLRLGGALLVNDYGYDARAGGARREAFQHYGPSVANGLNFADFECFVDHQAGWAMTAPAQDSNQVSSRLIVRTDDGQPGDAFALRLFRLLFAGPRRDRVLDLLTEAGASADARRLEEARWLYWQAREAAPRCWHVLERWAQFCLVHLKDAHAAAGLAQAALQLHPRHPALWNTLGDARYELGQFDSAESAFLEAVSVNARDIRARLNLAYVHQLRGEFAPALQRLAEALAIDTQGDQREALLEKQRQVLLAQSLDARDGILQQMNRFRNLDAPSPGTD